MRCLIVFCVGIMLALPSLSRGASVVVHDQLQLDFTPPGEPWVLSFEAPSFLVEKTVAELENELRQQGKDPGMAAIETAAHRRLGANEAFVCNPVSGACLVIDFSPLRPGEDPPSAKTVALSARYAGEGLEDEEGYSEVRQQRARARVSGAESAYRIDASYLHGGEPGLFVGIVGFVSPCWFYLYYTDPLGDPRDLPAMEEVLRSMRVTRRQGQ